MMTYRDFGDHNNSNDEYEGEDDMANEYEGGNTENEEVEVIDGEVVDNEDVVDDGFSDNYEDEYTVAQNNVGLLFKKVEDYKELDAEQKAIVDEIIDQVNFDDFNTIVQLGEESQELVTRTARELRKQIKAQNHQKMFEKLGEKGKALKESMSSFAKVKETAYDIGKKLNRVKNKTVSKGKRLAIFVQKSVFRKVSEQEALEKNLIELAQQTRNEVDVMRGKLSGYEKEVENHISSLSEPKQGHISIMEAVQRLVKVRLEAIGRLRLDLIATRELRRMVQEDILPKIDPEDLGQLSTLNDVQDLLQTQEQDLAQTLTLYDKDTIECGNLARDIPKTVQKLKQFKKVVPRAEQLMDSLDKTFERISAEKQITEMRHFMGDLLATQDQMRDVLEKLSESNQAQGFVDTTQLKASVQSTLVSVEKTEKRQKLIADKREKEIEEIDRTREEVHQGFLQIEKEKIRALSDRRSKNLKEGFAQQAATTKRKKSSAAQKTKKSANQNKPKI